MRTFAISFLILATAAIGGYYYWNTTYRKLESPLRYFPENSNVVFVSQNADGLKQLLDDTSSIFQTSPARTEMASSISKMLKPLAQFQDSIFIACSVERKQKSNNACIQTFQLIKRYWSAILNGKLANNF